MRAASWKERRVGKRGHIGRAEEDNRFRGRTNCIYRILMAAILSRHMWHGHIPRAMNVEMAVGDGEGHGLCPMHAMSYMQVTKVSAPTSPPPGKRGAKLG